MINIKNLRRRANIAGWLMSIPAMISIGVFIVYPIVMTVYISTTDLRMLTDNVVSFVGFDNFIWLFSNASAAVRFWEDLLVSLEFTVISTLIQSVLGFLIAVIMYYMTSRVQGIFKILIYIPVILPATVVSVMWQFFYQPVNGLFDTILRTVFGVNEASLPGWISDPNIAIWSVILTNTWRFVGITVIIYFVAMNAISKDILESAGIDGASKPRQMLSFILPLTWSSTKINMILSMIGGLKSFDLFYLLTNGDAGTEVVGLYIFKTAFVFQQPVFSRASTMAIMLTVILAIVTILVNKLFSKEED